MTKVVEEMASNIEETAASCDDVDLKEDWMNPVQGPDRPKLHVFLNDRDGCPSTKLILWLKGDFAICTELLHFHFKLF